MGHQLVELICLNCECKFHRRKALIKHVQKHRQGKQTFCCCQCAIEYKQKDAFLNLTCEYCRNPFTRLKCRSSKEGPHYCSRSCSAANNNTKFPRKPAAIVDGNREYICQDAREKMRRWGWNKCLNCNYDWHIEACHINAVANVDKSTEVRELNSKENLVGLCRNCHWRFDHDEDPTFREKIITKKKVLDQVN